ncbi:MAG: hypothetical protein IJY88_03135 [Clostridia bacterium]|nr:hypothetical protein [Clostridia bacterium]
MKRWTKDLIIRAIVWIPITAVMLLILQAFSNSYAHIENSAIVAVFDTFMWLGRIAIVIGYFGVQLFSTIKDVDETGIYLFRLYGKKELFIPWESITRVSYLKLRKSFGAGNAMALYVFTPEHSAIPSTMNDSGVFKSGYAIQYGWEDKRFVELLRKHRPDIIIERAV